MKVASTQEKVARLLENSALIKDVHTEIVIKQENEVAQNAEEQEKFHKLFGELGDYIEVRVPPAPDISYACGCSDPGRSKHLL